MVRHSIDEKYALFDPDAAASFFCGSVDGLAGMETAVYRLAASGSRTGFMLQAGSRSGCMERIISFVDSSQRFLAFQAPHMMNFLGGHVVPMH